ncbi:hypothetical protein CEXT_608651 [Caerostris extrusa]|uniref:Ribosomal protein L4 n=1 Tax=Caerostris extrusa TaxID=172846 RepID=A0AAV4R4A5_CAEEX|nr:hypothetical protein CEXT_608651 [Caerostris extrusa]
MNPIRLALSDSSNALMLDIRGDKKKRVGHRGAQKTAGHRKNSIGHAPRKWGGVVRRRSNSFATYLLKISEFLLKGFSKSLLKVKPQTLNLNLNLNLGTRQNSVSSNLRLDCQHLIKQSFDDGHHLPISDRQEIYYQIVNVTKCSLMISS